MNRAEWRARAMRDKQAIADLLDTTLNNGSNCLDIGAHKGEFLHYFQQGAPEGSHSAIEALPHLADALSANFPDVTVHRCAVADRTGVAEFFQVVDAEAWSGLRPQPHPDNAQPVSIEVQVRRLDDLMCGAAPVSFIKIDVEGGERDALCGARDMLTRTRPVILFEHALVHTTHYDSSSAELYDTLADEFGYKIRPVAEVDLLTKQGFIDLAERSHASGYGMAAHTNFVAIPTQL